MFESVCFSGLIKTHSIFLTSQWHTINACQSIIQFFRMIFELKLLRSPFFLEWRTEEFLGTISALIWRKINSSKIMWPDVHKLFHCTYVSACHNNRLFGYLTWLVIFIFMMNLFFYWGEKLCRRFSYLCRFLRRLVREMRLIFNAYSWHPLFSYLVYYQMRRMTKYFGKYFNAQIYIHTCTLKRYVYPRLFVFMCKG